MKAKTTEEFRQFIEKTVGDEYTLLGTYKNNREKVKFKHNKCGKTFMMAPRKFIEGHRCPYCNKTRHKTIDEMRSSILARYPSMYLVDGYTDSTKPANFYHLDCCKMFSATPTEILRGKKCPYCSDKFKNASINFQDSLNNQFYGNILLTEAYKGNNIKTEFCCTRCGKHFISKPDDLLKFNECPSCMDHIGRDMIENFLRVAQIPYTKNEIIFAGCIMQFDFFINERNLAIDYAGHAYYNDIQKINFVSSDIQKKKIKAEYCKANKIKHLIIPYWEKDNINQILYSLFITNSDETSYTSFNDWRRSIKLMSYKKYKKGHKQ